MVGLVSQLREMAPQTQELLRAGRVAAMCPGPEGLVRYAKISIHNDNICVHHLQQHLAPPPHTYLLPYQELLSCIEPSSTLTFLDLGCAGSPLGRMFIRLSPDTTRGKQFRLLCTGETGPTYANTRILQVSNRGRPGETVSAGDYENNDGSGGASILPDLGRGGEYMRAEVAGTVWGRRLNLGKMGQFYVTTRTRPDSMLLTAFGQVVRGMTVLTRAASTSDISALNIVDCGVIIPH